MSNVRPQLFSIIEQNVVTKNLFQDQQQLYFLFHNEKREK